MSPNLTYFDLNFEKYGPGPNVGAPRLDTRAERARAAQATTLGGEWAHRSPAAFMAEDARASGALGAARRDLGGDPTA